MRGMVENYCPRGKIQPWPTIRRGSYRAEGLYFSQEDAICEIYAPKATVRT